MESKLRTLSEYSVLPGIAVLGSVLFEKVKSVLKKINLRIFS